MSAEDWNLVILVLKVETIVLLSWLLASGLFLLLLVLASEWRNRTSGGTSQNSKKDEMV